MSPPIRIILYYIISALSLWDEDRHIDQNIIYRRFKTLKVNTVNQVLIYIVLYFCNVHNSYLQLDTVLCRIGLSFVNKTSPFLKVSIWWWKTGAPCPRPLDLQDGHGGKKFFQEYSFYELFHIIVWCMVLLPTSVCLYGFWRKLWTI